MSPRKRAGKASSKGGEEAQRTVAQRPVLATRASRTQRAQQQQQQQRHNTAADGAGRGGRGGGQNVTDASSSDEDDDAAEDVLPVPQSKAPPQGRRNLCRRCVSAVACLLLFAAIAILLALASSLPSDAPSRRVQAPPPQRRCTSLNASSPPFAAILAPEFEDWALSVTEELAEPDAVGALTHEKAHVVLLVSSPGGSAPSTAAIDDALRTTFPACSMPSGKCVASLDAAIAALSSRGELQAWLVAALSACPGGGGLVVLHNLHRLPAAILPALLPLLSEAGQYTHAGHSVPAWRATVALTAAVPGLDGCGSVSHCQRLAKTGVHALVASNGYDEAVANLAAAFRRRVDDVALLRRG